MDTLANALLFRHRSLPFFPGGIAAVLVIVLAMLLAGCATYRAPVVAGVQAMAEDSFEIKVTERTDRRDGVFSKQGFPASRGVIFPQGFYSLLPGRGVLS